MSIKTGALEERLGHVDLTPTPTIVEESTPYGEVLRRMREDGNGAAIVVSHERITGIFTERDVLNHHVLEATGAGTAIGRVMTAYPRTVSPDTPLGKAIEIMHQKGIRNLPVVDPDGRPQGLLTVGRIIRYLADHFPAEVVNLPPRLHQISSETEGA